MPESGAHTLVVGAGYTGRRVLDALGADAIGLNRSGNGRRVYAFDLDTAGKLPVDPEPNYSLLYAVPPAGAPDQRLTHLLDALPRLPARIVYLSTTGVYGDCGGDVIDEDRPVAPITERAGRRAAAEVQLESWCRDARTALVVLRVPGIYGPDRLGLERIRERVPVLREADANPGNRIHVDDLVACCLAALAPDVPAGIYNVGDGDTRSSTWFALEVARQAGLEAPPTVSRDEAEKTFPESRLSFLRESRILNLTRMKELLRPGLRYEDASEGIAASLAVSAALGTLSD